MRRGRVPSITGRMARGAEWRPSADEAVTLRALPSAPAYLPESGRGYYALIVAALARRRAIERVDVAMIEEAASAYAEWARLDREIHEADTAARKAGSTDGGLMQVSDKNGQAFLSGRAQARAHCMKRLRIALGELGVGSPAARMAVFRKVESEQHELFDFAAASGSRPAVDPTDPFGPALH